MSAGELTSEEGSLGHGAIIAKWADTRLAANAS